MIFMQMRGIILGLVANIKGKRQNLFNLYLRAESAHEIGHSNVKAGAVLTVGTLITIYIGASCVVRTVLRDREYVSLKGSKQPSPSTIHEWVTTGGGCVIIPQRGAHILAAPFMSFFHSLILSPHTYNNLHYIPKRGIRIHSLDSPCNNVLQDASTDR